YFFFQSPPTHPHLHSFPTRRSSDLGNDTQYAADSIATAGPYFYRVSRTSAAARATVQHRVFGPVRVLVGVGLAHSTFRALPGPRDRKSTRLNSSHEWISYAVFCLKK